jgi:hypothetical protein
MTYQLENVHALLVRWQLDSKPLGHSPQDGRVDIVGPVGGTEDNDPGVLACCQTIPHAHKLGLHHTGDLMVVAATLSQERIDLVDKDNCGLHLVGQREQGGNQLVGLSEPLVGQG